MARKAPAETTAKADKPATKRRRFNWCENCGERYEVKARNRKQKPRFCKDECRYEFHHKGGPSFKRFETLVTTMIQRSEKRIIQRLSDLMRRLGVTKEIRDQFKAQEAPSNDE